jgi:hypothetical protein
MSKYYILYHYKDGSIHEYLDRQKVLHRTDGPAVDCSQDRMYFIDDKRINREKFDKYKELIKLIYD